MRLLVIEKEKDLNADFVYMNPDKPCFGIDLLNELEEWVYTSPKEKYTVFASADPGIFGFGGDLELFAKTIKAGDKGALFDYGYKCILMSHRYYTSSLVDTITISVVRGKAYGGAFEAALASSELIIESDAQVCFPEKNIGLFPGMGAYQFLRRKVGERKAMELISSSKRYSGKEIYDMGIATALTPPGTGIVAAKSKILEYEQNEGQGRNLKLALNRVENNSNPLELRLLIHDLKDWVDVAMSLPEKTLARMERLSRIQEGK
jgi:DSF synthase